MLKLRHWCVRRLTRFLKCRRKVILVAAPVKTLVATLAEVEG